MMYTLALALIDQADEADSEDYRLRAPAIIDAAARAGVLRGRALTRRQRLDDELEISDDTAARVMPYGLAKLRAGGQNGDMYADYPDVPHTVPLDTLRETDTADEYGILKDEVAVDSGFFARAAGQGWRRWAGIFGRRDSVGSGKDLPTGTLPTRCIWKGCRTDRGYVNFSRYSQRAGRGKRRTA